MSKVAVRPSDGGTLLTRRSDGTVGMENYVEKMNWRRDLHAELRREGYDYFVPYDKDHAQHAFPFPAGSKITLIHTARRPDGNVAIVIGTETELKWYTGDYDPAYGEDEDPDRSDDDYADGNDYWTTAIDLWTSLNGGRTFATAANGARRWEAVNVNGWTIFTNGVDPVVAWEMYDTEVREIDELLAQGVVTVGTLAEHFGSLFIGVLGEAGKGSITPVVLAGTDPSSTDPIPANVGQGGGVYSAKQTRTVPMGSGFPAVSGQLTVADQATGRYTLTTNHAFFDPVSDAAGRQVIQLDDGRIFFILGLDADRRTAHVEEHASGLFYSRVVVRDPGSSVLLDTSRQAFWLTSKYMTNASSDPNVVDPVWDKDVNRCYLVSSDQDVFKPEYVGRRLTLDGGYSPLITKYVSPSKVMVNTDLRAGSSQIAKIQTPVPTSADVSQTRHARLAWSLYGKPLRWGALLTGTAIKDSFFVATDTDATRAFERGQEVLVAGAGAGGGTLSTRIESTGPGGVVIEVPAQYSGSVEIIAADAYQTETGYIDLEDDGSGILRAITLKDKLVVFKDTSIFYASYTGSVVDPWSFEKIALPHKRSLHYRHVLQNVNNEYLFYAGREAFYAFDFVTRTVRPVPPVDEWDNLFFKAAEIGDTDKLWSADNFITKEIFIHSQADYDPNDDNRVVCFDYQHNTFSVTDLNIESAATIIRPDGIESMGETKHMFLLGTADGGVLTYGKLRSSYWLWGDDKEIWYRRDNRPMDLTDATKRGYRSVLTAGLSNFGDEFNEKELLQYHVELNSHQRDYGKKVPMTVEFYSGYSPSQDPKLEFFHLFEDAREWPSVALWYAAHNARERIVVDEPELPVSISGRGWRYNITATRDAGRVKLS